MNTNMAIKSHAPFPRPVEDFSEVDDTPPLTPQVMQKLEKRREASQEAHSGGGGFFGFLKKALGIVGDIIKGMGGTLIEVIKNPKKLLDLKFWRDDIVPAALNLVPKVGPLLSKVYQLGLSTTKGVKTVKKTAKRKMTKAWSRTKDVAAGLFQRQEKAVAKTPRELLTRV